MDWILSDVAKIHASPGLGAATLPSCRPDAIPRPAGVDAGHAGHPRLPDRADAEQPARADEPAGAGAIRRPARPADSAGTDRRTANCCRAISAGQRPRDVSRPSSQGRIPSMEALSQGLSAWPTARRRCRASGGCTPFGRSDESPTTRPSRRPVVPDRRHLEQQGPLWRRTRPTAASHRPDRRPDVSLRRADRLSAIGDGSIEVDLFNDSGPSPANSRSNAGTSTPTRCSRLLRKDTIGWGYTLFLPWTSCHPAITRVAHDAALRSAERGHAALFADVGVDAGTSGRPAGAGGGAAAHAADRPASYAGPAGASASHFSGDPLIRVARRPCQKLLQSLDGSVMQF